MTALVIVREKIIKPLLAASTQLAPPSSLNPPTLIDRHYEKLRAEMHGLFTALGMAA
jgi:hypothetical protein